MTPSDSTQEAVLEELRKLNSKIGLVLDAVHKAEQEVPEYMRRFTMYYHDLYHIRLAYDEKGVPPPEHIMIELERAHDRMRHILDEENNQGGTFHRIRQQMDKMEGNKYTHSMSKRNR